MRNNNKDDLASREDFERLEQKFDALLSNLSRSGNETSSSNSFVIQVPELAEDEEPDHNDLSTSSISPLCIILNHTFPEPVVDLVNKIATSFGRLGPPPRNANAQTSPPTPPSSVPPVSQELTSQLIDDYFKRLNTIVPILDKRKFDRLQQSGSRLSKLLTSATLAAAAARYSNDPSIRKTPNKPGGVFFDTAKGLLDKMYDTPRIETCQAILLLSHSEISLLRINSAYIYLGMAVQMGHSLKLDRNDDTHAPEDDEERRRLFYCLYVVDRWVSFMLGRPHIIDDINVDVPLPQLQGASRVTRNYFISLVKLSRILGQIWNFGYSSRPKVASARWVDHASDQKSMLRQIRAALAGWLKDLTEDMQYQYLPTSDSRAWFQMLNFTTFAGYINILFHTCIILVHQPYVSQGGSDHKYMNSAQGPVKTCLTAATTITDIAKVTFAADKNAFSSFQYPVFSLLQAALVELVIIRNSREYAQDAKTAFGETLRVLRTTSENSGHFALEECVGELERVAQLASGNFDILMPHAMTTQLFDGAMPMSGVHFGANGPAAEMTPGFAPGSMANGNGVKVTRKTNGADSPTSLVSQDDAVMEDSAKAASDANKNGLSRPMLSRQASAPSLSHQPDLLVRQSSMPVLHAASRVQQRQDQAAQQQQQAQQSQDQHPTSSSSSSSSPSSSSPPSSSSSTPSSSSPSQQQPSPPVESAGVSPQLQQKQLQQLQQDTSLFMQQLQQNAGMLMQPTADGVPQASMNYHHVVLNQLNEFHKQLQLQQQQQQQQHKLQERQQQQQEQHQQQELLQQKHHHHQQQQREQEEQQQCVQQPVGSMANQMNESMMPSAPWDQQYIQDMLYVQNTNAPQPADMMAGGQVGAEADVTNAIFTGMGDPRIIFDSIASTNAGGANGVNVRNTDGRIHQAGMR